LQFVLLKLKFAIVQSNSRLFSQVLQQLARDMGLKVEIRPVPFDEIAQGGFKEIAACGTAVVITPIKSITKGGKVCYWPFVYQNGDVEKMSNLTFISSSFLQKYAIGEEFPVLKKLYEKVRAVQVGDAADAHKWNRAVF